MHTSIPAYPEIPEPVRCLRAAPHAVCQRPCTAGPSAHHAGIDGFALCFSCQSAAAVRILQLGRGDLYALVRIRALRLLKLVGQRLLTRLERHRCAAFANDICTAPGGVQTARCGQFAPDMDLRIHQGCSRTPPRSSWCIQRWPQLGVRTCRPGRIIGIDLAIWGDDGLCGAADHQFRTREQRQILPDHQLAGMGSDRQYCWSQAAQSQPRQ